jgi:outer membrane protein assembly factor BamB
MTTAQSVELPLRQGLRLWPGILAAVLMWVVRLIVPLIDSQLGLGAVAGGALLGVVILVWWLFFSRAPWPDRIGAIVLMVLAIVATYRVVDVSIATGMMGGLLIMYGISALPSALVAGAVAGARLSDAGRRAAIAMAILLACAAFTMLRTDGITGIGSQFAWRWTPTAEETLLARANDDPKPVPPSAPALVNDAPAPASPTGAAPASVPTLPPPSERVVRKDDESSTVVARKPAEWPGFRGSDRDGIVQGVKIDTNWARTPPTQIWRRPIGPGWSSFAVDGDLIFTQEQRGEDEIVAAYNVKTGEPVWRHRDRVRFWESNGGAGPRATPTLDGGRVYAFGATGILNALDEASGAVVWSRNVAADSRTVVPMWGFASSPLVIDDEVVVAAEGKLAAYDLATGKPRWVGPDGGLSYSSPHRVTFGGASQIILLSAAGATSVSPSDGAVLWKHAWSGGAIVQPAMTADGDLLISALAATGGFGIRRLAVARGSSGWTVEERWTSTGLKPYYNDYVVHNGYAFGFDGSILSSIDLKDGTRKWKGGRYGAGQLVLLRDQDLLLVLSEEGDVVLVSATPDQFKEIARVPALEGKTWNHPVVVGDLLLVRNGEEMAAFRLPRAAAR